MNIQNEIHPLACRAWVRSRGWRRMLTGEFQDFIISYKFHFFSCLRDASIRGKPTKHTLSPVYLGRSENISPI